MSYAYLVTSLKASAVQQSIVCNWTSATETNLCIVKGNTLEIYTAASSELKLIKSISLNGRIQDVCAFRLPSMNTDLIFVLTERKLFTILAYDSTKQIVVTRATGNLACRVGRDLEHGQRAFVEPQNRMIGMHLYDGHLKILPIQPNGAFSEAFDLRLPDVTRLIDLKFLDTTNTNGKPLICMLFEDDKFARHIKTYTIDARDKEILPGPWNQNNLEHDVTLMIPVAAPAGGMILVGESIITYISGTDRSPQSVAIPPTVMTAYCVMDPSMLTFILGDRDGKLWVLVLHADSTKFVVTGMHMDLIGTTTIPSCISYIPIADAAVFVGSCYGDSKLLRLNDHSDTNPFDVVETYRNLGPILDMVVVASEMQGIPKVVTCSGAYHEGSLNVIRGGIGIREQATVEMEGIRDAWSLRSGTNSLFDKYLVQSFTGQTRILAIDDEEIAETEIPGFLGDSESLFCGNMINDLLLQVVSHSVRLVDGSTLQLIDEYFPSLPTSSSQSSVISVASANTEQVLLACGNTCVYLEIQGRSLVCKGMVQLDQDIASITLRPLTSLPPPPSSSAMEMDKADDAEFASNPLGRSHMAALGMWTDNTVRIIALPDLTELTRIALGSSTQARDVLLVTFDIAATYLFVGLGDGTLLAYEMDHSNGALEFTGRHKATLGTRPISLTYFNNGQPCIFASGDRPTIVYRNHGKLTFSVVNVGELTGVVRFHSELFPECLALMSESGLTIGNVESIQRLHVTRYPLGEGPSRIAYHRQSSTYCVLTEKLNSTQYGDENVWRVLFFSDDGMELIHTYELDPLEQGLSNLSCVLENSNGTEYVVVGTAYRSPEDSEPKRGRILVFSISDNAASEMSVVLEAEKVAQGPVYSLTCLNGKLVSAVDAKVSIYSWDLNDNSTMLYGGRYSLNYICLFQGHIVALYLRAHNENNTILTGDLLRSLSLIEYCPGLRKFKEVCRDLNTNYIRSVEIMPPIRHRGNVAGIDDSTYEGAGLASPNSSLNSTPAPPIIFVGADDSGNIFTLRQPIDDTTGDDKAKMVECGEIALGDYINVFRTGSLSNQSNDYGSEIVARYHSSCIMYGTVSGALGNLISISEDTYRFFAALEKAIKLISTPVGTCSSDFRCCSLYPFYNLS